MDEQEGFLPPEPPGPEPELGSPAAPQPPPPPPRQQQQWGPPNAGFPAGAAAGQQPPPPGQPWAPQPPPGWQPAPPPPPAQTWQPPPGQQPQQWPQQAPAWQPPAPGNSPAMAGFVLSVVAAGLLVVSFGTSSIVSLVCAVLGIVFSRKGRQNVDEGRTAKHRDLAKAGFITGIVALVLTVLATAAWIAVIVAGTN
jgi:autotransporter family porin